MSKTIIVSNRLPIEFKFTKDKIEATASVGGLATGLKSVHEEGNSLWIGWSGLTEEQIPQAKRAAVENAAARMRCATVPLTESDITNYYLGFSNRSLWPLFHYFMAYTEYNPDQWQSYYQANEKFAEVVLAHADEGDRIWVHDYQLLLLPKMLRDKNPSLTIGFFLHIPFPAFELIRTCPWRNELLSGILGADVVGFHTHDYVQHFLNSVKRIAGHSVKFNEILLGSRTVKADSFPMGIDYQSFHNAALELQANRQSEKSEIMLQLEEHAHKYPDSKLILSIDRMDYTKGIPNRIRAFEHFLEKYPQFRQKVRMVMLTVPSRINVPQYKRLKKETDELVGRINGKFGSIDWTPIWYFYRSMPFDDLISLYSFSHVALVTPLRDGMNLVAKEYVAAQTSGSGVLILSEMAGAASEMHEAILINPHNVERFADALKQALEMSPKEQKTRITVLQKRLSRYTVEKWAQDFMSALSQRNFLTAPKSTCKKLTSSVRSELISKYKSAKDRLLLLDYDGTLVEFCDNPSDACPNDELYDLLDSIKAKVAIISGRGKADLEQWFGEKDYTLISDHGVWMRGDDRQWHQLEDPQTDWKEIIHPIIESFVDRTPGTFIEEKQFSLVWHYRRANPELAEIRTRELKILLTSLTAENGLTVLEGDKVLEVKNSIVNKGRAATNLIAGTEPDFVFAAGDDLTDEFMFDALPHHSHTVKVGTAETAARYYIADSNELLELLRDFARA